MILGRHIYPTSKWDDSGTSLVHNLSEHHTSELNGGFHNNIHITQVWDGKWTNLVGQN